MPQRELAAIILAAGMGTRMRSELPKVLHPALGQPLVEHVLAAVRRAGIQRIVVVVGDQAERVKSALSQHRLSFALQEPQLGTGHAVQQAQPHLAGYEGDVVVLCGDTPLLTAATLEDLHATHRKRGAMATVLTAEVDDPTGYGRIVRAANGDVLRIVEQKDASEEEKRLREINSGLFVFDVGSLFQALDKVGADNAAREYYLTDTLEILRREGARVSAHRCDDSREVLGVNTPDQLREVEQLLAQRMADA
jgi:UDP-N-acetylglucosamine diphosphorylase/glucosamine-1-phosphate N-acetyltransferase